MFHYLEKIVRKTFTVVNWKQNQLESTSKFKTFRVHFGKQANRKLILTLDRIVSKLYNYPSHSQVVLQNRELNSYKRSKILPSFPWGEITTVNEQFEPKKNATSKLVEVPPSSRSSKELTACGHVLISLYPKWFDCRSRSFQLQLL